MASNNDICEELTVRETLTRINQAWTQGHPEDLEKYFHEDMVIAAPGFRGGGKGKATCVASYARFAERATMKNFEESEHAIDVWGDTAVAVYRFQLDYEMEGSERTESGYDVYVFTRQDGKWLAVWRTIIPFFRPA
jgi:ketosteroid isomerase-like protein